jgi:hypothetical protein
LRHNTDWAVGDSRDKDEDEDDDEDEDEDEEDENDAAAEVPGVSSFE